MSEEIIKVLDNLAQKFGIVIDWSNQNVMPYIIDLMDRFIKYDIATNICFIIVGIIALGITACNIVSGIKKMKKYEYFEWLDEGMFNFWGIVIFGFLTIVFLIPSINNLLLDVFVPEIRIFEYLQNLI